MQYFSIFAEDFELMKAKLSSDEIVDIMSALSELCLWNECSYTPQTPKQKYFWDKLKSKLDKDLSSYNASVENGKKGGRPKKETQNITQNITQTKTNLKPKTLEPKDLKIQSSDKSSDCTKNNFSNEFETWWGKYPNKKSKQDALKVFSKILSSKKATFDELMRGLDAYNDECKAKKTETHYIKHPSTWLNQGCWADEYNLQSKNRYSVNDDDNAKWERLFREA